MSAAATSAIVAASDADPLAARSPVLVALFAWHVAGKFARAFHAVRVARDGLPALPDGRPAIVFSNHPSWWDPALFFVLQARFMRGRHGFGPMDDVSLGRYGLLRRLGVFGIEHGARGAARFFHLAIRVLADPRRILWVTAEGNFTDARVRPVRLRPGVAHLARRIPGVVMVPLAIDYVFWDESKPEALVRFGTPIDGDASLDVEAWTARLEDALTATMDSLAVDSVARDPSRFETLVRGRVGVGGVYDGWRRLRASLVGQTFDPSHEAARQPLAVPTGGQGARL